VTKLLLARDDIKVNLKNACGRIPLLFTAVYGHETVMQLLLARDNINVDLRNYEGQTPLLVVSEEGHEALKLLLARDDVNVNAKAQRIRIIAQHYRGLVTRRSHAIDVNLSDLYAVEGHQAVAKLLLMRDDIDVHLQDASGR